MFNTNKRSDSEPIEKRENTETSIGSQCIIRGQIENPSSLKFHGHLEGSINCGDYLVICKEAIIDGDIEADTAVLYGSLTGSIRADKVELKSCAQIFGDIETYVFDMENGAFFNGNIKMLKKKEKINKTGVVTTRADLEKNKKNTKSVSNKSSSTPTQNQKDSEFVIESALFEKKK
ncbi:MAG: polymer-forming cytoskeletal protein [Neisseriaceae bacterium]|nr:polymer-forming cytoskeletal protein [Neisseriaceae bacterium]